MSEDNTYHLGDKIRLRSGPYAGRIGIVVRVNALENQRPSGALVMIKLSDGKINPCYVSNLEKIE
jgi:hypothetical protein